MAASSSSMSSRTGPSASNSRLMSEARDVASQQIPTVFAQPDESNLQRWHAMILGPPSTPYSLGLFHFDMKFPPDYPNQAPMVLITTTSGGLVRFNPNLYATGKVCLSILGTWRAEHSGEQWSAVQSVQSVLLSIQSLMNDKPYHNEPSFETDDGSGDVERYNVKILHETLRVAVCEVMEDTLDAKLISANGVQSSTFGAVRRCFFWLYYERYCGEVLRMERRAAATGEHKDGSQFKMMPFECAGNEMRGTYCWAQLKTRLEALRARLDLLLGEWRRVGEEQTRLLKEQHDASVNSCIDHLRMQAERVKTAAQEMPDGASIGPSSSNHCVWEATIFGPSGSAFDGGMFSVEFIFPPNYPDEPPYIRFLTPMYHPQISPKGIPYLRSLLMWHCCGPKERAIGKLLERLIDLLRSDPSPEPVTHVNLEAAELCFSRKEEERNEYKKQVRRKVQRSMDG